MVVKVFICTLWACFCWGLNPLEVNDVCVPSNGKRQPLVVDTYNKGIIYPTAKCGKDGKGETFASKNDLKLVCTLRNTNEYGKGECDRVSYARLKHVPSDNPCRVYTVGFEFSDFSHEIFSFCWDYGYMYPVWVRHLANPMIDRKTVDRKIRTNFRYFKETFGMEYNPKYYYTKQNQDVLNITCGKDYLARGHLSPSGDFFLASERWATFTLENVVPQWQSHNNNAWKEIENQVRNLNNSYRIETKPVFYEEMDVVYLDVTNTRIPVPHALRKTVYDTGGQVIYNMLSNMTSLCNKAQ